LTNPENPKASAARATTPAVTHTHPRQARNDLVTL
jgi:hypothetical protein